MSPSIDFSANQLQVLALISTGSTAVAAAKEAGVHRNTIANWLRMPEFRQAMVQARNEKALYWRECAAAFAEEAIRVIVGLMTQSDIPPSVRLRAALAVLDKATTPLPPELEMPVVELPGPDAMHNDAQSDAQLDTAKTTSAPQANHKTGRNELCPCGSGVKFKRCCLGKPAAPPTPRTQTAA
jgi:hypothetical protein